MMKFIFKKTVYNFGLIKTCYFSHLNVEDVIFFRDSGYDVVWK
jgi:hypothetical protein